MVKLRSHARCCMKKQKKFFVFWMPIPHGKSAFSLFQRLLLPEERRVSALPLPAVGSPRVKPGVALPADLLVAPVLVGQQLQRGLDDTTPQPQDQVEGRLLLDVVAH